MRDEMLDKNKKKKRKKTSDYTSCGTEEYVDFVHMKKNKK